jgi:peptide subunit release factor 1 (eRF1)
MLQQSELQELAERVGDSRSPILSLYLDVDPHHGSADEQRLSLRRLLAQAVSQNAAAADVDRVGRFFDHEHNRQGRSVACFSHQATGFWRAFTLLVCVENWAFVGTRPYIKPLTDVFDEYERFGVVTVDSEGARAFVYRLGVLEDSAGTLGAEVKRHKQGGWAAQKLQRHEDEEAKHNLKDAAAWADDFLREHGVARVVLSGTDGNVALFRDLLPRPLQDKVIGQVSLDMNASPAEVWERSFEVAQQAKRRKELQLLEQTITAAHKGGAGVVGLADTLAAQQEGRAYHLFVARNFHKAGQQCQNCSAVVIESLPACPYCGHELVPTADVVNAAIQQAIGRGLKVSILEASPLLEQAGNVAALLRY